MLPVGGFIKELCSQLEFLVNFFSSCLQEYTGQEEQQIVIKQLQQQQTGGSQANPSQPADPGSPSAKKSSVCTTL